MRLAHLPARILAATLLVSAPAAADVTVKWDCYLPNTTVDCAVLEQSLTSKIPFLKVVPTRDRADVVVTLTSLPTEDGARFNLDVVGRQAHVQTTDRVPSSVGAAPTMVRVMTRLERAFAVFLQQKEAAEVKSGKLSLVLIDPATTPAFRGRPEQSVNWYVAPVVSAWFSDVDGVGINASGSAAMTFNYSESRWRLQQWLGGSYSRSSQPVPGTTETASIEFVGGYAINDYSRDLTRDHRLSTAILLAGEKNPQANYDLRANGSVGLEFDLVPRQTVNQKNLGMRCALGPEYQHYDATNVQGIDQQIVAREFCDLYLSWHFRPVDLWASVGENVVVSAPDFWSFSAGLSATWRVTDDLMLSPWVTVQGIHKAINEAGASSVTYTDPRLEIEASMRAAVERGYTAPFGVQSGLSVKYVFGNGSLSAEDQRWRSVSSLR